MCILGANPISSRNHFSFILKSNHMLYNHEMKTWLWYQFLVNLVLYPIQNNIHGSISFMIDSTHYVNFRIYEQDSVPWCGEIQNKRLEVLGNTFNLHSNSTYAQEVWSLNQFPRENNWVTSLTHTHHFTMIFSLKIKFCMFLPL